MKTIRLLEGDCLASIRALPADSVDACVTDPPYHLTSTVKRFGGANAAPAKEGTDGLYARASAGFMGKQWDGGDIAFRPETWAEVYRVLKPGAHLVAFGAPRGYHRMACAIEDAGFEIRDSLMWVFGTGFPKSQNVAMFIDREIGVHGGRGEAKSAAHVGWIERGAMRAGEGNEGWQRAWMDGPAAVDAAARQYLPASPEAMRFDGWGTALKPAYEPIVLARKPLIGTVAENVLAHGTGALNIDGCRVQANDGLNRARPPRCPNAILRGGYGANVTASPHNGIGRWPANVLHDGSEEVVSLFPDSKGQLAPAKQDDTSKTNSIYGKFARNETKNPEPRGDEGSAARFFYSAKANKTDRAGSKHPTVKPVALMRYLCRLVTPHGGTILDPFAGSGTTGQAAREEGFHSILCEREEEYLADIRRRLNIDTPEDNTSAFLRAIGVQS